jgi:hypothetical protein
MKIILFFLLITNLFVLINSRDILRCYSAQSCASFNDTVLLNECYISMVVSDECICRPDGINPTSFVNIKFVENSDSTYSIFSGSSCTQLILGPIHRNSCSIATPYSQWILSSNSFNLKPISFIIFLILIISLFTF